MSPAEQIIKHFNSNAVVTKENGLIVMIEDVIDPDGRVYRIEYRSTPDGKRANGYCLFNPWGGRGNPNAGEEFVPSHVASDGFLCLKPGSSKVVEQSPYDLEFAIKRARYWCTGFSVLKETGTFPQP